VAAGLPLLHWRTAVNRRAAVAAALPVASSRLDVGNPMRLSRTGAACSQSHGAQSVESCDAGILDVRNLLYPQEDMQTSLRQCFGLIYCHTQSPSTSESHT